MTSFGLILSVSALCLGMSSCKQVSRDSSQRSSSGKQDNRDDSSSSESSSEDDREPSKSSREGRVSNSPGRDGAWQGRVSKSPGRNAAWQERMSKSPRGRNASLDGRRGGRASRGGIDLGMVLSVFSCLRNRRDCLNG